MLDHNQSAATPSTLDHAHLASDLDAAHRHGVAIDRHLRRAGLAGWCDPARRESLAVLEHLHRLRIELDRLAGGPDEGTPYVLRPAVAALSAPGADRAGAPPTPFGSSEGGKRGTGVDDRGACLVDGLSLGPSSATPAAPAPSGGPAMPDHGHEAEALTSPPRACEPA